MAFPSRYGQCLREWLSPKNTWSPARQRVRADFGHNSQMWSATLTEEQQDRWNAAGPQVHTHPRLGDYGPMTGQQFWQSISTVRSVVGLPPALEPPAPVAFNPSPVGPLTIENTDDGVRLYLAVTGDLTEDVMVFGEAPCSAGRRVHRHVCYLGLLPPPIGGRCEITRLYQLRFGAPRPDQRVFIVTNQTKNGWKALDRVTHARVPPPPEASQALATALTSHTPEMHTGRPPGGHRLDQPASSHPPATTTPEPRAAEGKMKLEQPPNDPGGAPSGAG